MHNQTRVTKRLIEQLLSSSLNWKLSALCLVCISVVVTIVIIHYCSCP
jgi:hypothetical protein